MEDKHVTYDGTPDFNDCIGSNLPPRAMRYTMESKNNLREKGSLYVGLGETRETTINVGTLSAGASTGSTEVSVVSEKYEIPRTGVINPPDANGTYVLVCKINNGNVEMGWVRADSSFDSRSIVSGITDVK